MEYDNELLQPFHHSLDLNGVHAFIRRSDGNGDILYLAGWTMDHWNWKIGDVFCLTRNTVKQHGTVEIRESCLYRLTEIDHKSDPRDMYLMTVIRLSAHIDPRLHLSSFRKQMRINR